MLTKDIEFHSVGSVGKYFGNWFFMAQSIYILEPSDYSLKAISIYSEVGNVVLGDPIISNFKNITVLVVRLAYVLNKDFLSKFPELKVIISPTTAITHIDEGYCQVKNIKILSLSSCKEALRGITSTSELAFGLIIALVRNIPKAHEGVVESNAWNRDDFKGRQLNTLSLGVLGLGRIGSHLASYANAFGMKVKAYDIDMRKKNQFESNCIEFVELDELLSTSDVISINVDYSEENINLIGEDQLLKIKSGAYLINTARGALLDEKAAANLLVEGKLSGIAVDVLSGEHGGCVFDSPLVELAKKGFNVIVTPHLGGCTSEAMTLTEEIIAKQFVKDFRYE